MLYMHVTAGMLGLSYSSYVTEGSHVGTKDLNCKHELSVGSDSAAGGNPCTELLITHLPGIIAVTFCCLFDIAPLVEQFL